MNRRVHALDRGRATRLLVVEDVDAGSLAAPLAAPGAPAWRPAARASARRPRRAALRGPSRAPRRGGRDVVHAPPERAGDAAIPVGDAGRGHVASRRPPRRSTSVPATTLRAARASGIFLHELLERAPLASFVPRGDPRGVARARRRRGALRRGHRGAPDRSRAARARRGARLGRVHDAGRPPRRRAARRLRGGEGARPRDGVRLSDPAGQRTRRSATTPGRRACPSRTGTCAGRSTSRSSTRGSRTSPTGRATRWRRTRPTRSRGTSPHTTWIRRSSMPSRSCSSSACARGRTTRRASAGCSTASCAASARRGGLWSARPGLGRDRRLGREPARAARLGSRVSREAPRPYGYGARGSGSPRGGARRRRPARSPAADPEDVEPAYFGWEIARCAPGLAPDEPRVLAALAAACVASMRAGSTRLPLSAERPDGGARRLGGCRRARRRRGGCSTRARSAAPGDPVTAVIGRPGERKPLIVDGEWLYAERMHALEERFCARIRERAARRGSGARGSRARARRGRGGGGAAAAHDGAAARRARGARDAARAHHGGPRDGQDRDGGGAAAGARLDREPRWRSSPSPRPPARPRSGSPTPSRSGWRSRATSRTPALASDRARAADAAPSARVVAVARALRAARERPAALPVRRGRRGVDDRPRDDGPAGPRAARRTRGSCCSATPTSSRRSRRARSSGTCAPGSARFASPSTCASRAIRARGASPTPRAR